MAELDHAAGGADLRGVLEDAARRAPGLLELILVDAEGVLVARSPGRGRSGDAAELAVEAIGAVGHIGRAAVAADVGAVSEWHAVGNRGALIVARVPRAELFVIARVAPGEWLGRARLTARLAASRLADVL